MEFKVGDIVQLKSGGPIMTVEDVGAPYPSGMVEILCVWFEKVGSRRVVNRERFSAAILVKAAPGGIAVRTITR